MVYEFSIYAFFMGALGILAVFISIYPLFSLPKSRLIYCFSAMVGSAALWCLAYMLEIAAINESVMMFWVYVEFIGIVTLPPFFLLFVLVFTNRLKSTSKPIIPILFFLPCFHWVSLLTNEFHHLFYQSTAPTILDPTNLDSAMVLDPIYGPFFYFNVIYSYILTAIGLFILIRDYYTSSKSEKINILYQRQLLIVLIGVFITVIGNILHVLDILKVVIDITPIFFVVFYIIATYALFEMGFLDIIPIARDHVFEEITDGLIVVDSDWRLVDLNTTVHKRIFPDIDPQNIYGQEITDLLKRKSTIRNLQVEIDELQNGLKEIKVGTTSYYSDNIEIFNSKNAQRDFFDIVATPLRSKNKKELLGFVIILREVTERRKAEILVDKKSRTERIILQLLSHDLVNHLVVLKGHAKLADKATDPSRIKKSLEVIDVKTTATLKFIDEVKQYIQAENRLQTYELQKNDLVQIAKKTILDLLPELEAKNLTLKTELPGEPANVIVNLAMKSVIFNLLMNATKFSPDGGQITVRLVKKEEFWRFSVEDQGPGIPNEMKERVFNPFVSYGENKGTGLGLTIAKETVQFFLGRMWIEDVQPQGAAFFFEIPRVLE